MLFLPAAALCCLCSALAAMATQLIQDDLTLTRRVGGDVSFSCRGTGQCATDFVLWHQKRDTETFTRILRIDTRDGDVMRSYNHPQKDDFSAVNEKNGCELQIQSVKLDHSATYYCSCWIPTVRNAPCSLNKNLQMNRCQTVFVTGRDQYVGEKDHFTAESGIQLHQGTGDPVSSNTEGEEDQQARPLQPHPVHPSRPLSPSVRGLASFYREWSDQLANQIADVNGVLQYWLIIWTGSPQQTHSTAVRVFVSLSFTVGGRWYYLIFGSGTKLIVSDEPVVKPVVSVYPAASRAHLEGKSSLLCLASAMFPPLVQFSWKRRNETGPLEELSSDDIEQLEIRESGHTASILLIHQKENSTYKYRCDHLSLQLQTFHCFSVSEVPAPAASCPPERDPPDQLALEEADLSFQSQCRVKLFCLLYTQLIVKSLVYCCGLSLLMILRNKGPSTSCSHAD
ncbi:uncharacterized protein LOC120568521 [Perca fluviatilis]|uniref:uncharacterized protein LOC120568521 n=1 Tax=Perca fluviatilis TaxID=8168 RepID=UPI0019628557|nr:uncharacterized protein LOC120568521 [Perca fluviatilis]